MLGVHRDKLLRSMTFYSLFGRSTFLRQLRLSMYDQKTYEIEFTRLILPNEAKKTFFCSICYMKDELFFGVVQIFLIHSI